VRTSGVPAFALVAAAMSSGEFAVESRTYSLGNVPMVLLHTPFHSVSDGSAFYTHTHTQHGASVGMV
jgi:hypothetical protein